MKYGEAHRQLVAFEIFQGDHSYKQWNKYWIDAERTVKVHSIKDIHPIEFGVLLDLGIVTQ